MKINIKLLMVCIFLIVVLAGSVSANDQSTVEVGLHDDGSLQIDDTTSNDAKLKVSAGNTLASSENDVLSSSGDGNFSSLAGLVRNGGNVVLNNNYMFNNTTDRHYIHGIEIVLDNTVIDGQNHIIDANNISGIFNILASNVTIKNIIFTNSGNYSLNSTGDIVFNGGALHFNASAQNAKVLNCTFEDCMAWQGSAIFSSSTDGLIDKCKFYNCTSALAGGAIYLNGKRNKISDSTFINCSSVDAGGAIFRADLNGSMDNSTFKYCRITNSSDDLYGGAVYWSGDNGNLTSSKFINCSIVEKHSYNNYTQIFGGAVFWKGSHGLIRNCNFTKNEAVCGGAVFSEGEYLKILNSTFTENSGENGSAIGFFSSNSIIDYSNFTNNNANNYSSIYLTGDDINISNSKFEDNVARRAGAIIWNGNKGFLANSTFNRNNATSKSSGAIHWNGKNGIMEYCNFTYNYAKDRSGGAVRWANQNGTIDHCNFINNTADLYAGAVYWEGKDGKILNSNFTGNSVKGIITDDYGYATGYGGAISISGKNVLVNNSNFENNSAKSVKNNINSAYGGAIYSTGSQTHISNSNFNNNTALKYGGAIYLTGKDSNVSNSSFTNCSSGISGGAVYWNGFNGVMDNSTFNECYVENHDADLKGGAIYWNAANGTVKNCNLTDCMINKTTVNNNVYGGGIYWNGENGTVDNSTFVHCYFDADPVNHVRGLCIYWMGKNGVVNNSNFENCLSIKAVNNPYLGSTIYWNATEGFIDNSTFKHMNSASGAAILIAEKSINATVKNSTFYNCTSFFGGAIYSSADNTKITNSTFINCSSSQPGGAVYLNGDNNSIVYSEFSNCSAEWDGGAISSEGNYISIKYSNFTNCSADDYGGAISIIGMNSTVNNSNFDNCSADGYGGAISISGMSSAVNNSNFDNCSADVYGGAIYISEMDFTVNNSNFNNCAAENGGAVVLFGDDGTLANSTFDNCSADINGGAVYWSGVNGNLANSTFDNCSAVKGGAVIWFGSDGNLSNSNFTDCSADSEGGAVYWNGVNGIVNDSNFTNCSSESAGAVIWYALDGTLANSTFDDCSADVYGGAICWIGNKGNLSNSNFTDCSAVNGGSVYWYGEEGTLANSSFDNCSAADAAGAIQLYGINSILANSTFTNCSAGNDGGAIKWEGNGGTVYNSTFDDCSAGTSGGAILWKSSEGKLENSTFINCSADEYGGAVFWDSDDGLINDSYFDDNKGDWRNIYLTNPDDVTVSNNTFADTIVTIKLNSTKIIYGNNEIFNGTYDTGVNINKTMNYTVNTTSGYYDLDVKLTGNVDEEVYLNHQVTKPNVGLHEILLGNTDTFKNVYLFSKPDGIFEVIRANSSVEVGDDEVQYNVTANVTLSVTNATDIKVVISDSKGNNITSKVDIIVDDDYTYILVSNLPAGNYTINVTAVPDNNHNPSSDVGNIKVIPAPSVVNVGHTEIVYNSTANVPVSVINGTFCEDDVRIFKDGVEVTPASVEVIDGVISVSGLDVGNYTVNVTSVVDENHTSATSSGWINVIKANSSVAFNNTTVVYGDEISVPVVAVNSTAGPVIVAVTDADGQSVEVSVVDGVIVFPDDLDVGVYNVVVTTNVTGNYNNATAYGWVNVTKANSTIKFNDTVVPYNVTANVPLDVVNATDVTVVVADSEGNVVDANVTVGPDASYILIDDLPAGNYTVNVTTVPDGNHYPSSAVAKLTVVPAPSVVTVGHTEIVYNSTANVTVSVINGTVDKSNVEIYKGGQKVIPASLEIVGDLIFVSGLDVGNYTVNVSCSVDENHTSSSATGWINVIKANSALLFNNTTSVYGSEITVPVTVENATGIIVSIVDEDGNPIQFTVDGNNITLSDDLDVGMYYVNVTTNVTDNYNNATSSGWINITPATIIANITVDDVTYPNHPVAVVNASVDGNYTVTVGGKEYPVEIINGTGSVDIDKLPVGNYTAYVAGNIPNYYPVSEKDDFTVKPADPDLKANVSDETPRFGENITVSHELPGDATGNITYYVDGVPVVTLPVNETFTFTPETPGIHNITVHYNGDRNYVPDEVNLTVDVVNYLTIIVDDVYYPNHPIAYVTADYDGNYTIKISPVDSSSELLSASANSILKLGEFTLDVEIINGSTSVDLGILAVGDYMSEIYGELPGIKTYGDEDPFKVLAISPNLDAEVSDYVPKYGDNVTVTPVLPDDATGNVTYIVDGKNMGTLPVNESFTFIPTSGEHVIEIIYNGDRNYTPDSVNKIIHVHKLDSDIEVISYGSNDPVTVSPGEAVIIKTVLPADATGIVKFYVNGKKAAELPVGEDFIFTPTEPGRYVITAVYSGDDKYNPSNSTYIVDVEAPVVPVDHNESSKSEVVAKNTVSVLPETGNPVALLVLMFVMIFASYRGRKN